jgi:hypothetical protein
MSGEVRPCFVFIPFKLVLCIMAYSIHVVSKWPRTVCRAIFASPFGISCRSILLRHHKRVRNGKNPDLAATAREEPESETERNLMQRKRPSRKTATIKEC